MWASLFRQCKTVPEIKALYRKLAKEHHPDHGGTTRDMQDINAAYHQALESCHGQTTVDPEGETHTYRYNRTVEQSIMDKIAELLALRMQAVDVELVGFWLWIHGDTRTYRTQLKAAACEWHSKRQMWYWRQVRSKWSNKSFDDLRAMYGSTTYANPPRTDDAQLAA